jgi:hypothetical protein
MKRDLSNIDYRLQGYFKKKTYDAKGDTTLIELFANYDEGTEVYSNLKLKEVRTVTRDATLGIPNKVVVDITWFEDDEVTVYQTKQIIKYLNSFDGMSLNQASRTVLVEQAQGYLLGQVGLADTQEFGTDVMSEREAYIAGTRQPLLDAISASTRTYMTQAIKDQLNTMLDIQY